LSVVNDKIGPTNTTSAYGDITYRLKVSENAKLGIGIKAGINMFAGDFQGLSTSDPGTDGVFQENLQTKLSPNFGVGLYLDGNDYFVGLSAPNLLENSVNNNIIF